METDAFLADATSDASRRSLLDGERVYFVPYRWWKEGQDGLAVEEDVGTSTTVVYTSSPCNNTGPMKLITNIFASDLVFNLKQRVDLRDGSSCECSSRDYALLTEEMWLQTLKRKHEEKTSSLSGNISVVEDNKLEVYPLQLRLSFTRDSNQLTARISKKDNLAEFYKRACKIFNVESEPVQIWDLSGQTASLLTNERINVSRDFQRQTDQELLLELQVYRVSDTVKNKNEGKKEDQTVQRSRLGYSCASNGSLASNGSICNIELDHTSANSFMSIMGGSNGRAVSLGLTGLQNLGNTCFMNSAIQCLAHTPKLVEYFLGDYNREINQHNPLGMNGELAVAFGELLRKLWAPGKAPVAPQLFKSKLTRFAPQFSGFNQHDSQELLAFLLDGLHEDLNRVKHKPYIEAKDIPGRPDEEVADEYWANHLTRNDSVIVGVCQGQYRSTLVCPMCNKVSVTFDPFMYLSLPLPIATTRTMTVTVFGADGMSLPNSYTVSVPKLGKSCDLIKAVSAACALRDDEKLLIAEIYNHRIIRYLEEPSDSLTLIRDDDRLVAYKISKDSEKHLIVVFMHQQIDRNYITGQTSSWKAFGIPLMTWADGVASESDIRRLFQTLLVPFRRSKESIIHQVDDDHNHRSQHDIESSESFNVGEDGNGPNKGGVDCPCFTFLLSDEKGISNDISIDIDSPVLVTNTGKRLHVLVRWPEALIDSYEINCLSILPEVYKAVLFSKRPPESVSLYACLEAFLREEPLGPDDMWYCPNCKMHRQACKKLDLWRLPEVLVIHLKRFSYSRFMKNKLETFVDFPIHDLDLSHYIAKKSAQPHRYKLYAVSNHYGGMGGGHYTAYVHHIGENHWYDFDDSHVSSISEEKVRTSAAYVLFYGRVAVVHPEA